SWKRAMVEAPRGRAFLPDTGDPEHLRARRFARTLHRRARRLVLLGVASRLDRASALASPRSFARRQHLLSRDPNACLLGCDSAACDPGVAVALVWRRSHRRVQPRPGRRLRAERAG